MTMGRHDDAENVGLSFNRESRESALISMERITGFCSNAERISSDIHAESFVHLPPSAFSAAWRLGGRINISIHVRIPQHPYGFRIRVN